MIFYRGHKCNSTQKKHKDICPTIVCSALHHYHLGYSLRWPKSTVSKHLMTSSSFLPLKAFSSPQPLWRDWWFSTVRVFFQCATIVKQVGFSYRESHWDFCLFACFFHIDRLRSIYWLRTTCKMSIHWYLVWMPVSLEPDSTSWSQFSPSVNSSQQQQPLVVRDLVWF